MFVHIWYSITVLASFLFFVKIFKNSLLKKIAHSMVAVGIFCHSGHRKLSGINTNISDANIFTSAMYH